MAKKCLICGKGSTEVLHEHHVIPQAYGGRDMGTVTLCAEHHNMIHSAAIKCLMTIRSGSTVDFVWPNNHGAAEVAEALVYKIVEAALKSKVRTYKITLTLDQTQRDILGLLKQDLSISSLEKTVLACLDAAYRDRFGG